VVFSILLLLSFDNKFSCRYSTLPLIIMVMITLSSVPLLLRQSVNTVTQEIGRCITTITEYSRETTFLFQCLTTAFKE